MKRISTLIHSNIKKFSILNRNLFKNTTTNKNLVPYNSFFFKSKFSYFCTLDKLNVEKLKLNKLEEKPLELNLESKETKEFNKEDYIIEYTPQTNWEETVLKSEIPVVVDCYADWCGPCKKLYPILEKKLEEQKNFKLVKINIDENGELAEMLSISSVPAVFLVYKGNVVDSFVGLPDQNKLNTFFESIILIKGIGEDEKIIRAMLAGADEYMDKKVYDRAENMLNEAWSHQRWRSKYGHIIKLGLALCAFNKSEFKSVEKFLKDLKMHYKSEMNSDPLLSKKLALLEMRLNFKMNPELTQEKTEDMSKEIEKSPKDLSLRYKLAVHQFENSEYEQAINTLLEIIQIDRNWNNKAANQLLIQIFNFLGINNKLTIAGRSRLTKILY